MSFDRNDLAWQNFLTEARNYIEIIDSTVHDDLVDTCAELHEQLLDLQVAVLALPETTSDSDDPAMVTEAKRADRDTLRRVFDFRYCMSKQVLVVPPDPEATSVREISDDLAELYDTLQDILALNEQGYIDDAVWQAHGGYVEDWGYLVVSVQAALWKYVAEAAIDQEEAAKPE